MAAEARLAEVERAIFELLEDVQGPEGAARAGQEAELHGHALTQATGPQARLQHGDEESLESRHTPRMPRLQREPASLQAAKGADRGADGTWQAPVAALAWLEQIRSRMEALEGAAAADRGHLAALEGILGGQAEGHRLTQEILLEDQADHPGCGAAVFEHDEEPTLHTRQRRQPSRNAARDHAQTCGGLPSGGEHTKYISSGANSRAQTPERERLGADGPHQLPGALPQPHAARGALVRDPLSQSLDSFVRRAVPGGEDRSPHHQEAASSEGYHAANLSDYVRRQQASQSRPRRQQLQNYNDNSPDLSTHGPLDAMSQSCAQGFGSVRFKTRLVPASGAAALQARLLGLIEASELKSQTILSMRQEIERLEAEAEEDKQAFEDEREQLERLVEEARDEKEQICNVYQQENRMRQELEVQVDHVKSVEAQDKTRIADLQRELAETVAKLEQEGIDKLKTEQSAQYWQSSFEEIEKHYLEEKEKAEAEIGRLTE